MSTSTGETTVRSFDNCFISPRSILICGRGRVYVRECKRSERSTCVVELINSLLQAYLFDRRQVGRSLQAEWGMKCDEESYVTCVRRFGRQEREQRGRVWSDHITGARMAQTNSHEVRRHDAYVHRLLTSHFIM